MKAAPDTATGRGPDPSKRGGSADDPTRADKTENKPQGLNGIFGELVTPQRTSTPAVRSASVNVDKAFADFEDRLIRAASPAGDLVKGILEQFLKDKEKLEDPEFQAAAQVIARELSEYLHSNMSSPEKVKQHAANLKSAGKKHLATDAFAEDLEKGLKHVNPAEFSVKLGEALKEQVREFIGINLPAYKNSITEKETPALATGQDKDTERQKELYNALSKFNENYVEENGPKERRNSFRAVIGKLTEIAEQQLSTHSAAPAIEENISLAGGSTVVSFREHEPSSVLKAPAAENRTTVSFLNVSTNIEATFSLPDGASPEEKAKFQELLSFLGRESGPKPDLNNLTLENAENVPDLRLNNSAEDLAKAYKLLHEATDGNVEFKMGEGTTYDGKDPIRDCLAAVPEAVCERLEISCSAPADTESLNDKLAALNSEAATDQFAKQLATIRNEESLVIKRRETDPDADLASRPAIESITVRREQGEYFVELKTKTLGTDRGSEASATISFRLDTGENSPGIEGTLNKLSEIITGFERETARDVSQSSTVESLLALGELKGVKGLSADGKPARVTLENVNWLGEQLAPDASFEYVSFKNSSLDFTGIGPKFKGCGFYDCNVALRVKEARFEGSYFDKSSMLTGSIEGVFDKTSIRGNAYNLDMTKIRLEGMTFWKGPMYYFKGMIVDTNKIPPAIKSVTVTLSKRQSDLMHANVEQRFNGDAIRGLIHQYSNSDLKQSTTLRSLFKAGGFVTEVSMDKDRKDREGNNAIISTKRDSVNGYEIIDVFPAGKKPEEAKTDPSVNMLRLFIDRDKNVHFVAGPAAVVEKVNSADREGVSHGNAKAFQAVLDFVHSRTQQEAPGFIGQVRDTGSPGASGPLNAAGELDEEPVKTPRPIPVPEEEVDSDDPEAVVEIDDKKDED